MNAVDLVRSMYDIQQRKEALEDVLKRLNGEFDFLRISKIPARMQDEGIERLSVAGVGRVSLTADMHVSVKAGERDKFYDWLRDNGRGDLIQENVNASTLKAAVKRMFASGEEVPEDLLNVSPFTRASITKA
jgi:hypothetical protein